MPVADQGVDPKRYTLIPRVLVFLTRDEHVLLLKGAPTKRIWANLYNGIGGHIERGEDIYTAARREILEEAGLNAPELWLCGVVTVETGQNPGIGIFILRGGCPDGELAVSREGNPEWIPISDVQGLPLVEDLYSLLPKILAARVDEPPFSAHYYYDKDDRLVIRMNELS
jgi:8-oxo-dGTP diphosphatase